MGKHLERAVDHLKSRILVLSARVEEAVRGAVLSVEERDTALALQVVDGDYAIDKMEVEVEEECLQLLALYQPVAVDLRFIITVLKINGVLERIGDLAVNIAERSVFLAEERPPNLVFDLHAMGKKAQSMLSRSLDALVRLDAQLARDVCRADDEVDAMNREMYTQVKAAIRRDVSEAETLIHFLGVVRDLERTADLATTIANDVIYLAEGEIVRHHAEDFRTASDGEDSGA